MRLFSRSIWIGLLAPMAVSAHTVDLSVGEDAFRAAYEGDVAPAAGGDAGGYTTGVEVALGATLYGASVDDPDEDVSAVALTGELYVTPQDFNRARLAFAVSYAPEVLTFGEGKSLLDTAARIEYEVLNETRVYIGYRLTRVELEDAGDQDLQKGAQLGLNITF